MLNSFPFDGLDWIQGSPANLKEDFQLVLLIQPNCPGCISHAIGVANAVFRRKQLSTGFGNKKFGVFCVATAFEDFELNTPETTQQLLNGQTVGVSKQRLGPIAPNIPEMPVAFDHVVPKSSASKDLIDLALHTTKGHAAEQLRNGLHPPGVVERLLATVGPEVLPLQLGAVFYSVRAQGTPTWVCLQREDNNQHNAFRILASFTGQQTESELLKWMNDLVG